MKPITYFVQNNQIENLGESFGYQLQDMGIQDRMILRTILSQYSFGVRFIDADYIFQDAIEDLQFVSDEGEWLPPGVTEGLTEALEILEGISAPEADALIEAINSQLRDVRGLMAQFPDSALFIE